jgi:hypothetical protein
MANVAALCHRTQEVDIHPIAGRSAPLKLRPQEMPTRDITCRED